MKVIVVTSVGLRGTVEIEAACVVNDDVAEAAVRQVEPLASQLALDVRCVSPDPLMLCIEHLEHEIADGKRAAAELVRRMKNGVS